MASSCRLLNTFYPVAHSIPTALQFGQEQCSPRCSWDGHGPPILPPAETLGSPKDPNPARGTQGMEQGEQHCPNHLPIPTQALEKKGSRVRNPNVFFCLLPASNAPLWSCTGCGARGSHPARSPPASPPSRDRTWQRQQLRPEPLQVSPRSTNKSHFSSPARFLAELMAWAPLGTQHLRSLRGKQQGRELRPYFLCQR